MEDKFIGKRLDGRYEIHELIGVGGMAYVYRAYDRQEDRWVAIKILKEEFSNDSDFLRRFRNESKAIALLSHPNIVRIYDVSFGDQIQYIVMEYIDGITLKQYIEQQGAIRWQEVVHFMIQILDALEVAHDKGIIHRDIKPQNILLLSDGTIKVTDFGIARFVESETQTMTDKAIGSVHYISPEQARGDYITDKADIYSTGVMMYEMLTGRLPFVADTAVSVALMQLQAKPRMPREINRSIPRGLEQITMKAMEKNPADRFTSVGEMLDDIEDFKRNPNIVFHYDFLASNYTAANIDDYDVVNYSQDYSDDYEYEEELVKAKRRKKGSMAIKGVLIAVILVGLVVGAVYLMDWWKNEQQNVDVLYEVPNFIGMNYETEIQGKAEYANFTFKLEDGNDPNLEDGAVMNQEPKSGISVKKGREIVLIINGGAGERVSVPEVTNYEQAAAVETLTAMGLNYEIQTIADDEIETGHVVKTDPIAGSPVVAGSKVILYVSKGPETKKVKVPQNLVGDLLYNVTAKIEDAKLIVGNITYDDSSSEPSDRVIAVNPASNEEVAEGTAVNITVSSGKGAPKTLTYTIEMPTDVDMDLQLKVYKNGSLIIEDTINPAYTGGYDFSSTGTSGVDKMVVKLNGQDYMYIDFDYDNKKTTMTDKISFTPPAPDPPSDSGGDSDTGAE